MKCSSPKFKGTHILCYLLDDKWFALNQPPSHLVDLNVVKPPLFRDFYQQYSAQKGRALAHIGVQACSTYACEHCDTLISPQSPALPVQHSSPSLPSLGQLLQLDEEEGGAGIAKVSVARFKHYGPVTCRFIVLYLRDSQSPAMRCRN